MFVFNKRIALSLICLLFLTGCITSTLKETYVSSQYDITTPGEATIFIEKSTTSPEYQNRVSTEAMTTSVALAFQTMGARIVDSKQEADYFVQSTITQLADLFDNVVYIQLNIKAAVDDTVVYSGKYGGIDFTQPASMNRITVGLKEASPEIYASINKHYDETGGRMGTLPPVETAYVSERVKRPPSELGRNLGNRYALVIGNSSYKDARLKNPVNDARDIVASLRRLGFTVIQKTDASLRQMEEAMNTFYASLRQGGVGLFYFAGHGVQVKGRNYLIPTDASINSESDVKFESMDAGRILGKMEDAGNALNIIILDACRNNPFARSFRSATRGLARMDAPTGSIVAYATAPGSVAEDGTGRNGVYTKHLLQNMMTPDLDLNDIFFHTRRGVIKETDGRQVPWESSSLVERFYFIEEQPGER
ncbi:MAG: caspase family protein [Pseudodesulfovibrio sp.]